MLRAALDVTSDWPRERADLALRAAGLSDARSQRPSLDAIAGDSGVSRETVRRARNELVHRLSVHTDERIEHLALGLVPPSVTTPDAAAVARALRRVLTMTGPMPWDKVLSAWARAAGKHPYLRLPSDTATMQDMAAQVGGFIVTPPRGIETSPTIAVAVPEQLDNVSQFLYDALKSHPSGVDRSVLLGEGEAAGLKPTTIATTLSQHPAVVRLGRGTWALRGDREPIPAPAESTSPSLALHRSQPTVFSWDADGALVIEFSVPRGASPMVAVPKAVAEIIEGREFDIESRGKRARIKARGARLWGFGPLIEEFRVSPGQRVRIRLNLIDSTAAFDGADARKDSQ